MKGEWKICFLERKGRVMPFNCKPNCKTGSVCNFHQNWTKVLLHYHRDTCSFPNTYSRIPEEWRAWTLLRGSLWKPSSAVRRGLELATKDLPSERQFFSAYLCGKMKKEKRWRTRVSPVAIYPTTRAKAISFPF